MSVFKCKMCGGDLSVAENQCIIECEYCGSNQTVPTEDNEKAINLFNRANRLRIACEFDKAAVIYENIIAEYPEEAEAYWGLCLCNYGIEYVDDPVTANKIPTCHRASFRKLRKDTNYESALEYAAMDARVIYEEQAKEIDRIMGEILALSKDEQPYDIFICYKESDNNGGRTPDSVLAQDIYDNLTQKGYRVFFSRITLEDKLGVHYEPYIFSALNSAKMMLVVGTDYEYMNAVWVRNEWSRFLRLISEDKSKVLIPCYQNMDPYDMPDQFAGLQSQDCSKLGFMQDLTRGVDKIFGRTENKATVNEVKTVVSSSTTDSLLERAFMFLEDGKWKEADEYCEKVLDIEPKNSEAYLGKLMAELQVKKKDGLCDCEQPFDNYDNCIKASKFNAEFAEKLKADNEFIKDRNETARKQGIYDDAINIMQSAKLEDEFKAVAASFEKIKDYKDSDERHIECLDKAEAARKNESYNNAVTKMSSDTIEDYVTAISYFESIGDWKDSHNKIDECNNRIEEISVAEEKRKELLREQNTREILKYKSAKEDLKNQIESLGFFEKKKKKELINKLSRLEGPIIKFGNYFLTSGKKGPVEWRVLDVKEGMALVISEYALDCQKYNESYLPVTWETCTLRKWLNEDFYKEAFSDEEQKQIQTTKVTAYANHSYSTNPGNDTNDKVFLLSITEVNKYFSSDEARICKPTKYAKANGAYVNDDYDSCWWWLRSPGGDSNDAADVFSDGGVSNYGIDVDDDYGCVRPALWIKI